MLIVRRLKLLSPLLAAKHSNNPDLPRRVFVRLSSPPRGEDPERIYLTSDLGRWEWAFLEARDALEFEDVAVSAILPCRWYSVKRTSTYNRKFRRGGNICTEQFESLPSGQVFEMKFTLSKHVPPNTDGNGRFIRPPDEEEFDEMLAHIGEHLGMSEWGHARQYGRFEIKQPVPSKNESQPTPESGPTDEPGDELPEGVGS